MGIFSQLLNRFSTGQKQIQDSIDTGPLQLQLQALKGDLANLRSEYQADAEKTSKKLESYRARSQPRKDGKFSTEDRPEAPINGGLVEQPTHDQIEDLARSKGLIR